MQSIIGFNQGRPLTSKQKFQQTFSLRHGQTLFMAGLPTTSKRKKKKGIPILQDLPILGKLFEGQDSSLDERKLLVFVTPYVSYNPKDLADIMKKKSKQSQIFSSREDQENYRLFL